jgi:hypothetical protein
MGLSQSSATSSFLAVLNLACIFVYVALFLICIHHNIDTITHPFKKGHVHDKISVKITAKGAVGFRVL